jgi:hypothetical protein
VPTYVSLIARPAEHRNEFKLEKQSNQTDRTMNRLLVALTLATLVASPALAKPRHAHVVPGAAVSTSGAPFGAQAAFPYDSNVVIKDGHVIGADPDPAIRVQIFKGSVPVGG